MGGLYHQYFQDIINIADPLVFFDPASNSTMCLEIFLGLNTKDIVMTNVTITAADPQQNQQPGQNQPGQQTQQPGQQNPQQGGQPNKDKPAQQK
jgi:hypothetical protein